MSPALIRMDHRSLGSWIQAVKWSVNGLIVLLAVYCQTQGHKKRFRDNPSESRRIGKPSAVTEGLSWPAPIFQVGEVLSWLGPFLFGPP